MTEDGFVRRVFEIAGFMGLAIEARTPGPSICFNETSKKWLDKERIRRLFPAALNPKLTDREINQLIESVAPGRPCTHVKMRKILRRIHLETDF